jgi:DNA replication protein DnaC
MIDAARGVDAGKVARLGTGDYIKKGDSIIVTGASGCGKSFLATALGYLVFKATEFSIITCRNY